MSRESVAVWHDAPRPGRRPALSSWRARRSAKRAFDLSSAALLILVLAPALAALALLIWAQGRGGPVLIRHERIGAGGRRFKCLKFRTMCVDAQAVLARHLDQDPDARREWEATFKLRRDPRVTPLGRVLRKTSLDELPQLFNVLAGEMSLVGPRPITDKEIHFYGDAYAHYLSCTPGLTGLWQISGRSDVGYDQRVRLDTEYAQAWSLALDMKILAKTPKAVLFGSGAH